MILDFGILAIRFLLPRSCYRLKLDGWLEERERESRVILNVVVAPAIAAEKYSPPSRQFCRLNLFQKAERSTARSIPPSTFGRR